MNPNDERDPLDRIFARLERVEPPTDLTARIMARVQRSEAARWAAWQKTAFGIAYVAALLALAVLSFLTGTQLEHSHVQDLLSLAIHDASIVSEAPGVYFTALREAIPWLHVLAVAADVALVAVATRFVLKAAPADRGIAAV